MSRAGRIGLRETLRASARWLAELLRLVLGRPAGHFYYALEPWPPAVSRAAAEGAGRVDVRIRAEGCDPEAAVAWCARQTLVELAVVAHDPAGRPVWRADRQGHGAHRDGEVPEALWFGAPGRLPEVYPAFFESAFLVAAAEAVDAVALRDRLPQGQTARAAGDLLEAHLRPYSLFSSAAYDYDPRADAVRPRSERQLVKVIESGGVAHPAEGDAPPGRYRRGPYLSTFPLPLNLRVGVRDVAALSRRKVGSSRPTILVTLSFLAHGGVEHVLFETLKELGSAFDFTLVTLAPHRPELGDRRRDFAAVADRLLSLGDLLHPAAMYGVLVSLVDQLGTETLFNTNGTTLFYEIAPRLKAERPRVRIIDQLYDHRIGYVTWYDRTVLESVDTCVAVNRQIARTLVEEKGWPSARVPVIWPCGRRREAFPGPGEVEALRGELGYGSDDVVFLTAARMNAQKRPLDLVRLAGRVRDLPRAHFLIVGGGELAEEVDAAIAAAPGTRVRRLPFRDDVPRLAVAADVGCLVSDFEGLPVFMMECFQAGRPFLGTAVGDMGDVLRSTGGGLVVERPGDLAALEAAVRRLCDPEERRVLAERARKAAAMFDVETCAGRYGELFAGRL